MRGNLFEEENETDEEENETDEEEIYYSDEKTELETLKEHYNIILDYAQELEKRNIKLKEKIGVLERKLNYYEKQINGEV